MQIIIFLNKLSFTYFVDIVILDDGIEARVQVIEQHHNLENIENRTLTNDIHVCILTAFKKCLNFCN